MKKFRFLLLFLPVVLFAQTKQVIPVGKNADSIVSINNIYTGIGTPILRWRSPIAKYSGSWMWFDAKNFKYDSVSTRTDGLITGKALWIDPNGVLKFSNLVDTNQLGYKWSSYDGLGTTITGGCFYNGLFYFPNTLSGQGIATSPDGKLMTYQTTPTGNTTTWYDVFGTNGTLIAVGKSGTYNVMRSTDNGTTWSYITGSTSATNGKSWRRVTSDGNGNWVACAFEGAGTDNIMTSHDDGLTWTRKTIPVSTNVTDVFYGDGYFFATRYDATGGLFRSSDLGDTWTALTIPAAVVNTIAGQYGNGVCYVISQDGGSNTCARSLDRGDTWEIMPTINTTDQFLDIEYGNGVTVIVNRGTVMLYSVDDGATWNESRSFDPLVAALKCIYGNGIFSVRDTYSQRSIIAGAAIDNLLPGVTTGGGTIDTNKVFSAAQGRGTENAFCYLQDDRWVMNDTSYVPRIGADNITGNLKSNQSYFEMGLASGNNNIQFSDGVYSQLLSTNSSSAITAYVKPISTSLGSLEFGISNPTSGYSRRMYIDGSNTTTPDLFVKIDNGMAYYNGDYSAQMETNQNLIPSLKKVKQLISDSVGTAQSTSLADGQIWIGDGTNTAFPRTLSGDVTVSNLGVTTVNTINSITKNYFDPTSSIQTQLNAKQATIGLTTTGAIGAASYSNPTINIPKGYDELGTLGSLLSYTGTQWNSSSTWDIASAGGSFTFGSNKLALSGSVGSTTFTNNVFNSAVLGTSSSYLSNLDTHEEIVQCSPTSTPSATTYGFSVGLIPKGVCYQTGLAIKVDWTSTNFGKIYIFVNGGGGYSLSATSNNGLATATAGDGYSLSIKTIKGNITATLTCTSSATAANVGLSSYVTLTNTVPSTYVYGFFQHGGTTDITSLACNSQLATGAEVCFIGTSITRGSTPVDVNYRYADVISQNCKGRFIINAGNGNCSADAYYTSTQVLSLAPKTIFIEIGINDWAFGVSNATYMSNLALLIGAFTSNGYTLGVNLFILSIPPTDSDVSGVIQTWNTTLRSTYPSAYIDIYTELKSSSNPNNLSTFYNSGDNLHWNTLGHQTVAKLLINRLPLVFITKDVNRAGFQPLLFSQHSSNKAGLLSISALGIGSSNPQAVVHAVGTTGIRVDRNGTNYTDLTTNASGGFLVTPNGGQTIIAGNSTANALLVSDASNASGAIIGLVGGGSNPSKYIRANSGNFEVINDAFSSVLMSISNAGSVSIGGVVPSAKLHVTSTTAQLRLDYSSSFYTTLTTSAAGNLSVTPNGGNMTLVGAGGSATLLSLSDAANSIGCNLRLEGGGSNPSKYIRANSGNLEVVNNAYNSILFTVADNGNVTLNGGLIPKSYTVATLPTPVTNMVVVVTDALAPTYNATVTGGGSVRIPVMYDGANWKCR